MIENVAEKWPDLFHGLTESQTDSIVQAVISGQLEGHDPDRATVDLLCQRSRGEINHAQYLQAIRRNVRSAAKTPAA